MVEEESHPLQVVLWHPHEHHEMNTCAQTQINR